MTLNRFGESSCRISALCLPHRFSSSLVNINKLHPSHLLAQPPFPRQGVRIERSSSLCDRSLVFVRMPPTTIHSSPALDSFTSLAEHQSQTPTSFYGAKPVLHYHGIGVTVLIAQDHTSKLPIFTALDHASANVNPPEGSSEPAATVTESVDAFVTSEYVLP